MPIKKQEDAEYPKHKKQVVCIATPARKKSNI
jgi:hypothetical protein